MTDNRTTELLPCPFCGGEAEVIEADYGMYMTGYAIYCRKCCLKLGVTGRLGETYEWSPVFNTEAEAIAAWNARAELASGTCPFARPTDLTDGCAALERITELEATRGTLTAEQVRECVKSVYFEGYNDGSVNRGQHLEETDWQAIADELNARAERTCEPTEEYYCKCGQDLILCDMGIGPNGGAIELDPPILFNYCPNCGAKVRNA